LRDRKSGSTHVVRQRGETQHRDLGSQQWKRKPSRLRD
jgi:hypothetical protein